ncbi:putative RNA methyltransferase [Gorillibacterium sp. sgz5001074]|uniref:putative RNA methyltransferase n=1 Tax=Gorillibacterium sp. sgz5001074 TaxID=3446695 RepID=UPI003F6779C7
MNGSGIWACPVCGEALELTERCYRCPNRHTYDLAAKGYVNLLLAHQRKTKDPGDSKMMLAARRRILEAGGFRKLAEGLAERVAGYAEAADRRMASDAQAPFTVLEAGCGEGYYLESAASEMARREVAAALYGIDISKDAVAMAAGGRPGLHYAVASSRQLPVRSGSVDGILQIFAPHSDSEFHRVLRERGRLWTVIPGKHHLYGLKELLYPKPYLNDELEHPYPSFRAVERFRIEDTLILTGPDAIRDLVLMTPYYWRTEPAMLEKLTERGELVTPLDFAVTVYERASTD